MYYFAYGSNMSRSRLIERVSSAKSLGCFCLKEHDLRFHKLSKDGSGKCDAFFTANPDDVIYGVAFQIDPSEKTALDKVEGLGFGYGEKEVIIVAQDGESLSAITYFATKIDDDLKPYSWYVNHVLTGAREASLPPAYVNSKIKAVDPIEDSDRERDAKQRAIHY